MTETARPSLPLIAGLALMIMAGSVLVWAQNDLWGQNPLRVGWENLLLSTDDAARIVQVRDLAGGQGWFDLRQMRLGADGPVLMHWSRLVDLPLLLLQWAAETVTDPAQAERAAAALWPRIVAFFWVALSLTIAGQLAGRRGVWCAAVLILPAALIEPEFRPGRVDHHNLQLVLVLAVASATIAGQARPALAALGGAATALSLAIGLEALPVLAATGGVVALAWAVGNTPPARAVAAWFSLGLLVTMLLAMVGTLPPMALTTPLCDQLSPATAIPIGIGCAGLVALTLALDNAGTRTRLLSVGALAVLAVVAMAAISPHCLTGPYAEIDAEVLAGMDGISERKSVFEMLEVRFGESFYRLIVWPLTGLAGLAAALLTAPRGARFAPALLLAMALMAAAVSWVELRGNRISAPLTFFGGVWLLTWITRWPGLARAAKPVGLAVLLFLVTPLGWIHTPGFPSDADADTAGPATDHAQGAPADAEETVSAMVSVNRCFADADAVDRLAALPPGRVLAHINLGPYLLLRTPHHVIAAPYHRNISGLRAGFRLNRAEPAEARALAAEVGADYFVFCPNSSASDPEPGSLLADLAEERAPHWLEPLARGDRLRVYRVAPAADTAAAPAAGG